MKRFTRDTFDAVLAPETAAVVGFIAGWCAPSRLQTQALEKLAAAYEGRILVGTIDVDTDEEIAERYGVKTLPGILLFAGGELVESLPGYQPEEFLRSCIEQLIQPAV
ncbi:MAG TPA: thioredoxin domain-containing protein [Candidatus Ozemobacteraceae bacterium]|nr:thioredoxin domain-containing protein [Candidatus Ozemobacteraceae bacterium]